MQKQKGTTQGKRNEEPVRIQQELPYKDSFYINCIPKPLLRKLQALIRTLDGCELIR